jgi:hypothetical protein
MKPTPKLDDLADACWNGACNTGALLRSLGEAAHELDFGQATKHPAVPIILGQLSYLIGESAGPSEKAIDIWKQYKSAPSPVVVPLPADGGGEAVLAALVAA